MNSQNYPQFKVLALHLPYVRPLLSQAIHIVFSIFLRNNLRFQSHIPNLFNWIFVVVSLLVSMLRDTARKFLLFYLCGRN
jgi:hypothetical protein